MDKPNILYSALGSSMQNHSREEHNLTTNDEHFIIAIGASAGGLESIHEFFDHMPENSNSSFIIIQHLSPDYKSLLVDLVSRHTHMEVFEAEDGLQVMKNCIYVIPNNKLITIRKNQLFLAEKGIAKVPNNAIDVFLYSLAKAKKNQAIAIILSGTGTDGTKGIEAIKEAGGFVLVQNPTTAKFDGMPNSAINSGNADYVLAPAKMPEEIITYIQEPRTEDGNLMAIDDATLGEIFSLIHQVVGFDFYYYKTPTLLRRINRRIARGNFKNAQDLLNYLRENPAECKILGKEFLIGVTKFFRDQEAFSVIQNIVIPAILESKDDGDTIKVWVSACSTGEEAYTLAFIINEAIEKNSRTLDLKIFATDLDESSIDIAAKGIYPVSIEKDIAPSILTKYFVKQEKQYIVIPRVRKQIVFAKHNIIKDPPFIKNDLVTCRNMLIYMGNVLQQRIYSTLLFAAKKNGYLLLGPSENPSYIRNSLSEVSNRWKIYKKEVDSKLTNHFLPYPAGAERQSSGNLPTKINPKKLPTLWDGFRNALIEDLNYTVFYIDQHFEIKEALGNYERILSLPKRNLRLNLLRMLPTGISNTLSAEIKKAWKTNSNASLKNIRFKRAEDHVALNILIKPNQLIQATTYTMVIINEVEAHDISIPDASDNVEQPTNEYVLSLEAELAETKGNLQAAIEDLETANEELQSSNEELLSANEELQSSNEELQSLNEELHTLNTEHQLKIKELIELNDDLTNYFRSNDIGQVFLDRKLNIRKFNPASARMINFIDTDLGRPITHISTNIKYEHLQSDLEKVLQSREVVEKEVQLTNGSNLLMRILPYLTRENENAGVVLSFVDITTITNLNNIIRGVFNSSQSAIFAFRAVRDSGQNIIDFKVQTANYEAIAIYDKPSESVTNKSLKEDFGFLCADDLYEKYVKVVTQDKSLRTDLFVTDSGKWYQVTAVKMTDGFVATFTDITQKKIAEQRLKKNYSELITAKETLKRLNFELENKVSERTRELSASEERFRLVARATNDALWDWNLVNNGVWWSDTFYTMFGYEKEESQTNRNFWSTKIHPDDKRLVEESINATINNNLKQWSQEYRFLKKNGSYAIILDRGYVLQDENGTPYRMLGSMLDLTALKEAEQKIESNIAMRKFLAESMPLIVFTAKPDASVDFVNKQFELYTGVEFDQALDKGWEDCIHPEDLTQLQLLWNESMIFKSDFQFEVRVKLNKYDYRWNILRAKASKDNTGEIVSWVVTIIDIHEQKSINEVLEQKVIERTKQLQEINQALETSNHDLQQFASVASHDLQEPLRKIHMFSKLVRDRFATELHNGAMPYLDKIMQSTERMKSLITNVLNFSRLSSENHQFELIDLKEIITDLLDDYEISIRDKKATIAVGELTQLEGIPALIRQVFQNLLSNALKFTKNNITPTIKINAVLVEEKSFDALPEKTGAFCKITVADNGIGFDEQFKENIFLLFHRLHSKDKYEGTGIGLAITKKIVEKHRGLITASRSEDGGACFCIILPVHQTLSN